MLECSRTRPALIEGEQTITYGELADRVLRTAGHLAKLGVVRGDYVGLCLRDDSQQVVPLLAVARLGAIAVQIDWRSRPTESARKEATFPDVGAGTSDLTGKACSPHGIQWTFDTYALAHGTRGALVKQGGDSWFFITADYAFGHALETRYRGCRQGCGR
jgi:hypothetical protein